MLQAVLAVDLGGTNTRVALVDERAEILATRAAPTPASEGPAAILRTVVGLGTSILASHPGTRLRGVGVGTAGVVDRTRGVIISATDTLVGWATTPVAELLRTGLAEHLGEDAVVDVQNDVDAHAWGEFRFGAARGAASVLVVAVGTGVGSGIIVNGAPLHGARHVAGEIAHVPTPGAEGLRCPCGRAGHLEAVGSGLGMHRLYLARGGDPAVADAKALVALAQRGDALARRALEDSASAVGRAVAGAVTLLDPEIVVLAGGVPDIGEDWWVPFRRAYLREAIDALQDVPLVAGSAGGAAALRGAADAAWARMTGTRS